MLPITKAILPVAGLGTRFLPATKAQPKEMLPLVDKPMIQFLVEEAVYAGIKEIIFVTGKGKRALEDHFDSAPEIERVLKAKGKVKQLQEIQHLSRMANFTYVRQQQARGDADALLSAAHLIDDEPVVILFGDDLILGDEHCVSQMMEQYHQTDSSVICLEKVPKSLVTQYGIVKARKQTDRLYRISDLVEKPDPTKAPSRLGVVGKYVITPDVWPYIRRLKPEKKGSEIRLADALRDYVRDNNTLYGYTFTGDRYDCGSKLGYLQATVRLGLSHPETRKEFQKYLRSFKL